MPGFDYSQAGVYFVTICVRMGSSMFGDVVAGRVRLNTAGRTAAKCWLEIPTHFPNVTLDAFVVMPNHVHGILVINEIQGAIGVGAQRAAPLRVRVRTSVSHAHASVSAVPNGVTPGSLGAIVRSFKSATTKRINEVRHTSGKPVWQRNYHDRIIRDDRELYRARRYILSNPDRLTRGAEA